MRLESRRTESTRLLYCTTGIALRMMLDDDPLRHVSHVVLDEVTRAHACVVHAFPRVTTPLVLHVAPAARPRVTCRASTWQVHERDTQTDLLLLLLRELLPSRPSLRVVLMSASLQSERFSRCRGY